jgi:hypothetical protein
MRRREKSLAPAGNRTRAVCNNGHLFRPAYVQPNVFLAQNSPDLRFSSTTRDLDLLTRSDLLLIDRRNDSAAGTFMADGTAPLLPLQVPLRSNHHLLTTCSVMQPRELHSSALRHYQRINRHETGITNHIHRSDDITTDTQTIQILMPNGKTLQGNGTVVFMKGGDTNYKHIVQHKIKIMLFTLILFSRDDYVVNLSQIKIIIHTILSLRM